MHFRGKPESRKIRRAESAAMDRTRVDAFAAMD
jgi:hypothetical protein